MRRSLTVGAVTNLIIDDNWQSLVGEEVELLVA